MESNSIASFVVTPPSKSSILIDSRYGEPSRQPFCLWQTFQTFQGTPANAVVEPMSFRANLSCNLNARDVYYNGLHWSQCIYTHIPTSSEFVFSVLDPTSLLWTGPYVVYHKPYNMFLQFDGNLAGVPLAAPVLGSYADDMEWALNNDCRNYSLNRLVRIIPQVNNTGVHNVTFTFRYSASFGFAFSAFDSVNHDPINIRLEDCSSIRKAHFVHGFGTLKLNAVGEFSNFNQSTWLPSWIVAGLDPTSTAMASPTVVSEAIPTLVPIREIFVYCDEINRDRRLGAIHNSQLNLPPNELAIIPTPLSDAGVMRIHYVSRDSSSSFDDQSSAQNIISLRFGTEPASLTFRIYSDVGEQLFSSTCWANFLNILTTDFGEFAKNNFFDSSFHFRSTDSMNLLLFGLLPGDYPSSAATVFAPPFTSAWGDYNAQVLVGDVIHLLTAVIAS